MHNRRLFYLQMGTASPKEWVELNLTVSCPPPCVFPDPSSDEFHRLISREIWRLITKKEFIPPNWTTHCRLRDCDGIVIGKFTLMPCFLVPHQQEKDNAD